MLLHPYSYRITIDKNPFPQQRICVLSYLCLLLTKVLFETSFKSFQYNTEGRRLSNYSIKLILCSHYRSMCKGLCQNKKHEFEQYTKGSHFCAAHMALKMLIWYINIFAFLKINSFGALLLLPQWQCISSFVFYIVTFIRSIVNFRYLIWAYV